MDTKNPPFPKLTAEEWAAVQDALGQYVENDAGQGYRRGRVRPHRNHLSHPRARH